MAQNPIVTITMKDGGIIRLELYPDAAPNTVNNFISLVKKGFYDGLTFHRVIPGFMIQGGDPKGTGMGGPGYAIRGEFAQNGYKNSLHHAEGVISMARTMQPNSAGSQFFICVAECDFLDGQYAAFGRVVAGQETCAAIAAAKRDRRDKPLEPVVMQKVTVELFGEEYPEPKKY